LTTALSKDELRMRLLIVDDEQSIRKLCVTVGEALGFICFEADGGDSALALLEEQPAHMVLTDMVMPHMSGLEFLEKVKKLLPRTEGSAHDRAWLDRNRGAGHEAGRI